VKHLIH